MISPLLALGACIVVSGEHITARDAAKAIPQFAAVAPETILGLTPTPGARRVLDPAVLARHVELREPPSACFEYETALLDRDALLGAAIRAVRAKHPDSENWRFHLVDHSRQPAPHGEIRFSAASVAPNQQDGSTLLRGGVAYSSGRSFPVWLRVRIEAPVQRAISRRAITAGERLSQADIEERELFEPAPPRSAVSRAAGLIGMIASRPIPEGAVIEQGSLRRVPDISRGDAITVEVISGQARLSFAARAEATGRTGDRIAISNPATGRRLIAVVSGSGKVIIPVEGGPRR